VFGNGEEHRHNLAGFGQGYGHVMLLNIKKLIQPVSIGPGIMKRGTDGLPLQRGIDTARRDGATIIWCHNSWGMESAANFVTDRVQALNIFDGGSHGSYQDSFYRYLNAGLRVPFSTGTDWFMYDFSRVYVQMDQQPLTADNWLKNLAAGRSYITNGPLMELRVNQLQPGGVLKLERPAAIEIELAAYGRVNFQRIELIKNGEVIATQAAEQIGGHFEAVLKTKINIGKPCWLAARTPPPPVKDEATPARKVAKNELGRDVFAHTSPVYVEIAGRAHFDSSVAAGILKEMQQNLKFIDEKAVFADATERQRVLDVHRDGIATLEKLIRR